MSWRQVLAALALILFAFQNYITQTHVHLLWQGAPDAFMQSLGFAHLQQAPAPDKQAPVDDPANCPICQDVALFGHFTTPAAIAILPPVLGVAAAMVVPELPARVAVLSHDWQGRAPPRR